MNHVVQFILAKFKSMVCVTIIINFICIIICWTNVMEMLMYILKSIFLSILFLFPIPFSKLNNFTGTTYFFKKFFKRNYMYLFMMLLIVIPSIAGVISAIAFRDIERAILLCPNIFGLYASAKAALIFQQEVDNPKYV